MTGFAIQNYAQPVKKESKMKHMTKVIKKVIGIERRSKMNKTHLLASAGEHRVAAELLIRGLNVGVFSVDEGTDLITETGLKIQIKASRKSRGGYSFSTQTWKRSKGVATERPSALLVDYLILWAVDDDVFFVIPADIIRGQTGLTIRINGPKYAEYRNAWQQLFKGE